MKRDRALEWEVYYENGEKRDWKKRHNSKNDMYCTVFSYTHPHTNINICIYAHKHIYIGIIRPIIYISQEGDSNMEDMR